LVEGKVGGFEWDPVIRRRRPRDDVACILLNTQAAQAVATVLHKLTTNARYGALFYRNRCISLRWRWLRNGSSGRRAGELQEKSGSQALWRRQRRYATGVIAESVAFELGGTVHLPSLGEGVRCRMEMPPGCVSRAALLTMRPRLGPGKPRPSQRVRRACCLSRATLRS